jgi:predicted DsbA family dithiol-disulfide isomerase
MHRIEVFADVGCPFTHVGLRRIVDERDRRGVDVPLWVRAWPLEWLNGEQLDRRVVAQKVEVLREQVAPDLFTGFDPSQFPATSVPAMALTAHAYALHPDIGEHVALAVRWALFEQGRDIAAAGVLLDIAKRAGINLADNADEDRVLDDYRNGQARGVKGSPHFFVGDANYFCPTLEITHRSDGTLDIRFDPDSFVSFMATAFPSP